MSVDEFVTKARDAMSARGVFADPVERDGTTVIAAASLSGGGGGGQGQDEHGQEGMGGGMGFVARPTGAYVLQSGVVRWIPAVDVNRLLVVLGFVVSVYLVTRSRTVRARLGTDTQKSPSRRLSRGVISGFPRRCTQRR